MMRFAGVARSLAVRSLRGMASAAINVPVSVPVRDRAHLPDSTNLKLPQFLAPPRSDFPRVLSEGAECGDASAWGEYVSEKCEAEIQAAGALMFKTNLRSVEDFDEFIIATGWPTEGKNEFARFMQARSMTSTCISPRVRTASDDHHHYTIEPHHEFHTAGFPTKIILFCIDAPQQGGEWTVGDGRAILRDLDPAVLSELEKRGVRYTVYYPSKESPDGSLYNNWEGNVMPTKEEAEGYLTELGYEWKWGEDASLTYWQDFPPVREHPKTGERVFFNQIHAHHRSFYECHPVFDGKKGTPAMAGRWPVHVSYSDGEEIPQSHLDHMRGVIWGNCVGVRPTPGDIIVYDNWATLHGRMGYDGPQGVRKVYVSATFD